MRWALVPLGLVLLSCEPRMTIPPVPTRWCTDTVGLLRPETVAYIDAQLEAYEKRTKHQVIVYVLDSTYGVPHADWSTVVHNAWGEGRKGHDDGAILFVFVRDDYRFLSIGRGFEQAIPDKEASRICREIVRPAIHAGQPDAGVTAGVVAVLVAIERWERAAK